MAAKLEEDTERREDDGNNDIDACSCAHFRSFGERDNLVYRTEQCFFL